MEDSIIVKDFYAYSLRVDAKPRTYNDPSDNILLLKEFQRFYDRLCPKSRYLVYIEQSKVVKKTHIQGILWLPSKQSTTETAASRAWWKRPKGGISFTSAKKIKSLCSYVGKDKGSNITNLNPEQLSRITEWKDHKELWTVKLDKQLQLLVSETNGVFDYAHSVIEFYIANSKAPPNRATLYKHLLRHHPQFTTDDYCSCINLFPQKQNYLGN